MHVRSTRSKLAYGLVGIALAMSAALGAASCSSTGAACADYPLLCGKTCTADLDCATGLYCGADKTCTADCSSKTHCGSGSCDDHGHCSGTSTGMGGSATSSAASFANSTGTTATNMSGTMSTASSCGDIVISFMPQTPTVMLLIDQSGSMNANFNGKERWDALRDALMDPQTGVVKALEDKVRFALTLYSGENGKCPDLTQVVPPALNNYTAINDVYSMSTYKNNTPTGESVSAVTPVLANFTEPGPKIIILGTDGDPDTCAMPDSNGTQPPKDMALAAVKAAFQQGIQTFIIAVGDQVAATHQQDMANAGVGLAFPAPSPCDQAGDPQHCAKSYKPSNQDELTKAFQSIIAGQRTCIFNLDGQVIAGKECEGTVTVNGMNIPCNDPNGWKLDSPTQIEFIGDTCALILADPNAMISGHFPCDAAVPPS